MPQMSPLNWLLLYIYMLMILLLICIILHFFYMMNSYMNKINLMKINKKKFIWLW